MEKWEKFLFIFKLLHLLIVCICVCECAYVCECMWVEIRGQFTGALSLLSLRGSNKVNRLNSKHLHSPSEPQAPGELILDHKRATKEKAQLGGGPNP